MASVEPSLNVNHDELIASLQVLANLKENQKIRILNKEKYEIAPDERWGFRRKLSGDGCQATIDMVSSLMETCIHHSTQLKNSTDDKLREKHDKIINLYPAAIQGLVHLYHLYSSSSEKEYVAAQKLAIKINNYITSVSALSPQERKSSLPAHIIPCEIPEEKLTAGKVLKEVGFAAVYTITTIASVYSTVTTAQSVISDVRNFGAYRNRFDFVVSTIQLIGRY